MATEEELVQIKIGIVNTMANDIKAMRTNMEGELARVKASANSSQMSFKSLGDEIKGNFSNAIKSGIMAFAGLAVVTKVTGFLKDARAEYQESVRAQQQLTAALGYTSTALNDQANALAKKLVMDNDEITAAQAMLANFVKDDEQIKKLTPHMLDLAAATGQDLKMAAQMLGRGIADNSDEFAKLQIKVDGARGSEERVDSVIQGLTARFAGQAEAVASAKDGLDSYAVAMNNIKENVGKGMSEFFHGMFMGFQSMGRALAGTSIEQIRADNAAMESKRKGLTEQENAAKKAVAIENDRLAREKQIEEERTKARKKAAEERKKIEDENNKQMYDAFYAFAESTIAVKQDSLQKELELFDLKSGQEIDKYKNNADAKLLIEQAFANQRQAIIDKSEADRETRLVSASTALAESEIALIQDDTARQLAEFDLRQETELAKYKTGTDERIMMEAKFANDKTALMKKLGADTEKSNKQQALSAASTFISVGQQIIGKQHENIVAYKAFAMAEAGMNTYVAATKALTATPWLPVNIAMMVATIALGLAQQAKIAKESFQFGTGYAGGGLAEVGERGRELVRLPRGSQIYSNQEIRNQNTQQLIINNYDQSGNLSGSLQREIRGGDGEKFLSELRERLALP
jgi:hypothetical protein